jgi:hypothetical protein
MSTVPMLFRGLVDDAALFPPGDAPMARAAADHRHHRAAPYAKLVGRFLCPESRVRELGAALGEGASIAVGVIADGGAESARRTVDDLRSHPVERTMPWTSPRERITVEAVEIPLPREGDLAAAVPALAHAVPGVETYVEIPLVPGWRGAVDACGAEGVAAKLRTGGLTAAAFPLDREVGDFIAACVEAGTPFKCTAGLHRAVRHTDPVTGFHHHGFLNILVATHAAVTGGDVLAAVTARDGGDLVSICQGTDDQAARVVRAAFRGFGSCSVAEPLQDLAGLGLLDRGLPDHLPVHH